VNTCRNSSNSEDSALFLIVIWNAASQAAQWRGQNEREKSKTSPNLRVGLPQFSTLGSVRGQYFQKLEPGSDAASIEKAKIRFVSIAARDLDG
jgi:hypothetical protein